MGRWMMQRQWGLTAEGSQAAVWERSQGVAHWPEAPSPAEAVQGPPEGVRTLVGQHAGHSEIGLA